MGISWEYGTYGMGILRSNFGLLYNSHVLLIVLVQIRKTPLKCPTFHHANVHVGFSLTGSVRISPSISSLVNFPSPSQTLLQKVIKVWVSDRFFFRCFTPKIIWTAASRISGLINRSIHGPPKKNPVVPIVFHSYSDTIFH